MPWHSALGPPSLSEQGGQLVLCLPSCTCCAAHTSCHDGLGNASTHVLLGLPIKLHLGKAGEGSGGSTSPCGEQSLGRMNMGLTKVYWYYRDLLEV